MNHFKSHYCLECKQRKSCGILGLDQSYCCHCYYQEEKERSQKYTSREQVYQQITVASKKRVIKNRNNPRFWGLEIKEKVLCGDCLINYQDQMPTNKKYTFNKYLKRGYWRNEI